MKKILLFIILFMFPIVVFAKTPTKDETLNVIRGINNVKLDNGEKIESVKVEKYNIIFTVDGKEVYIPFSYSDNKFSFGIGYLTTNDNHSEINIYDNDYSYALYSILVNKAGVPSDNENYYSNENIKTLLKREFLSEYKEPTNTFGLVINPIENNKYAIIYYYYLDGDYPIIDESLDSLNPATGNYNILITIVLVSILALGIYSYVNREKKA